MYINVHSLHRYVSMYIMYVYMTDSGAFTHMFTYMFTDI